MKEITELTSMVAIEKFITGHKLSFIYISRPQCTVCHAVLPQLRALLARFPKIKLGHINADIVEEVAGRFSVFTVPVLLLFIEGTECLREARFVHFEQLEQKLKRVCQLYEE
ncbi:thioredoxin family protein [Bacillus paralicheniformis]|uniref:thioredoxin family protein n=1 Tax=Bacillus paralicheniformis TaxID=1648923 RepID=UPI00102DA303|nr:thioredoxin family protein [Bacillus paralicheniformis]MBC8624473.1 thioredoxin family protein [Robertmurraya crescens]MCW4367736.1 thioredoxin family protein [Bacillus paralicheniformis]MDU0413808.1 thioredoxin family protein [Bacillus paralicheniformis]MED1174862.1 thioredoxin family protein [Bacillus paralicheniformis]RZV62165.1 thioredoxin [Bacillus paralicheniformis]